MRWVAYSVDSMRKAKGVKTFVCEKGQSSWSLSHAHTVCGLELAPNRQNAEMDGMNADSL